MKKENLAKLKRKVKIFAIFLIIFLCIYGICKYFDNYVNPMICSYSEAKVKSLTTKSINNAVKENLNSVTIYSDLINIQYNSTGVVTSISSNALAINKVGQDLISSSQTSLENLGEQGLSIPIGNFTGITLLSGRGPKVKIKIIPVGNMTAQFISEFSSAGINQTLHRIYIKLISNVSLILPVNNQKITTENQILIAESIIIGEVPDTYLSSDSLDEMLNLVPN